MPYDIRPLLQRIIGIITAFNVTIAIVVTKVTVSNNVNHKK